MIQIEAKVVLNCQFDQDMDDLKARQANRWELIVGTFSGTIAGAAEALF